MTPIKKDFDKIPKAIFYKARKDAFETNKKEGKYCTSDNLYKPEKVRQELYSIYNRKCAYCEKTLMDEDKHVEHYRPKKPYYWLAFSWDNLLIACKKCNELKSNHFIKYIKGTQLKYNNETLETAQSKIKEYNATELPLIINPERETQESLAEHFTFDLNTAKIIPKTKQMHATVEVCRLNRDELVEKRAVVLTDLKKDLAFDINRLKKAHQKIERGKAIVSTFKKFEGKINEEVAFIAWKDFILKNWKMIIQNL